jgi:hypothetical protein
MEQVLEKCFWILGILAALLNTYALKRRANRVIAEKPELATGYQRYALAELAFYSLPWLVMGVSILAGGVDGLRDYLKPCLGNPFVIAFYAIAVAQFSALAAWVWFGGGVEFFVEYSEGVATSPGRVKLTYTATLVLALIVPAWLWAACKFQG